DARDVFAGGDRNVEIAVDERVGFLCDADGLRARERGDEKEREREAFHLANKRPRSNRFFPAITGFQRSPTFLSRASALSIRNASMRTPRSTASHVTGMETLATGVGRTE